MPLATNPNKTVPIWLAGDADIPIETRPVFLCRFLTRFEIDSIFEELQEIPSLKDAGEMHARSDAVLNRGIRGWRNMTEPDPVTGNPVSIDFGTDKWNRILSPAEKQELGYAMLSGPRMSERDLGESTSSPTSTPDSSAPDVREERAPSTTSKRRSKSAGSSSTSVPAK